jgi:hypothetical protein
MVAASPTLQAVMPMASSCPGGAITKMREC